MTLVGINNDVYRHADIRNGVAYLAYLLLLLLTA